MNTRFPTWPVLLLAAAATIFAQVPDSPSSPQSAPPPSSPQPSGPSSTDPRPASQSTFLGKDVPFLDPSAEMLSWDGRNWNINSNRLFQARFEKYLNAPEELNDVDKQYREVVAAILDKMAPSRVTQKSVDEAFRLLPRASSFEIDARLCDALADCVYSAWRAQDAGTRVAKANESLEEERKRLEWNARVANDQMGLGAPPAQKEAIPEWQKQQQMKRDLQLGPYTARLTEILALIKTNQVKKEVSLLQAKIEFQALIVQFFLQRRFQHVLMATRFYRSVFSDGETKLELGKDSKDLFSRSTGMPPTVGTLDSMANEMVRDVREGVEAYEYLLQKNEMESATKRLAEAFTIGEYLPEIRTLPREKKRRALDFAQKSNQLVSALEVKDYTLAEKLVKELSEVAKDFDSSKPLAAIETARTVSAMHLAKARNAAVSGDRPVLEVELRAATEIWPRNPALAEVSGLIFQRADVQQQALVDMDRLISQKNYRQIFDERVRFIAAAALYPEKQGQLEKILKQMEIIEGGIIRANEISRRGDYAGAWESVEKVFKEFPDDNKLNQLRATLTTEAADFVRALRTAEQLEQRKETGSSLAWYLRAQKIYPASDFAREGVNRLSKQIIPEPGTSIAEERQGSLTERHD